MACTPGCAAAPERGAHAGRGMKSQKRPDLRQPPPHPSPSSAPPLTPLLQPLLQPAPLTAAMTEHHSRLTRFLSRFAITAHSHSKRKSSLPNLTNTATSTTTTPTPTTTSKHRSLSQELKPTSISLQPLLPLPTIIDRASTSSHHTPDLDDGADPNASIRPLTPSSKAVSLPSPSETPPQHSPTQSKLSHPPPNRSSSISNSSSEPLDDCKSTFGNASLASTKPTTVISLENGPTNRIAQPHPSPLTTHHPHPHANHHTHHHHPIMAQPAHHHLRNPARAALATHQTHLRLQSGSAAAHHSLLQPTTPTLALHSSPPLSPQNPLSLVNVPRHSLPHPSQNPHPAALADNASMLTLASSGFSPSLHHNQNFPSDEDASVRALAPSRRESAESLSSRWSNVKSTRTGGSIRTTGTGFYTGIAPPPACDALLASPAAAPAAEPLLSPLAPDPVAPPPADPSPAIELAVPAEKPRLAEDPALPHLIGHSPGPE